MVSGNLAPLDVIGTRTVLLEAFTGSDPESVKVQLSHQYLYMLFGSVCVKAAGKTLMKLT